MWEGKKTTEITPQNTIIWEVHAKAWREYMSSPSLIMVESLPQQNPVAQCYKHETEIILGIKSTIEVQTSLICLCTCSKSCSCSWWLLLWIRGGTKWSHAPSEMSTQHFYSASFTIVKTWPIFSSDPLGSSVQRVMNYPSLSVRARDPWGWHLTQPLYGDTPTLSRIGMRSMRFSWPEVTWNFNDFVPPLTLNDALKQLLGHPSYQGTV